MQSGVVDLNRQLERPGDAAICRIGEFVIATTKDLMIQPPGYAVIARQTVPGTAVFLAKGDVSIEGLALVGDATSDVNND